MCLRVSQINGCAYGIDRHSRDVLKAGLPVEHLAYRRGPKPAPFEFNGTSGGTITIDMNSKDVIAAK